jgi:hypothetical protein
MYVLLIVVCPFVLFVFLMVIVLSVLLRYTDSDCPFDIFKLFLIGNNQISDTWLKNCSIGIKQQSITQISIPNTSIYFLYTSEFEDKGVYCHVQEKCCHIFGDH